MGKYSGKTCRLLCMLGLTASYFLVEIIVGYVTNSIALVADSFHMLSDVVALIVGFASVRVSKWQTVKNTFGWARAEVLGALVNSVFLIALCFSILVESLQRLLEVEEIEDPKLMLIVGAFGLLINLIGLCLFHQHGHSHGGHGHSHGGSGNQQKDKAEVEALVVDHINDEKSPYLQVSSSSSIISNDIKVEIEDDTDMNINSSAQLNMRGVFLHVLGDALGSVIVVISALVIWFVEADWKFYVDPAMSVVLVGIILLSAVPLLKESGFILLQTVPTHIQVSTIKDKLEKINGVLAIHEFHVWQLAGNRIIASAHVRCHNLREYMTVAGKIKELFHHEGIHSTTIQPEFVDMDEIIPDRDCMLECGPDKKCFPDTCCAQKKPASSPNPAAARQRNSKTPSPEKTESKPSVLDNDIADKT